MGLPIDRTRSSRVETLSTWQERLEERTNKTLFWLFVLTVFYVYYGFVSPALTKGRIEEVSRAREVLETITGQFKSLSTRYSVFVGPPTNGPRQPGSDIGLFTDKLIPETRKQELTDRERELLDMLDRDMRRLSDLYNDHIRAHRPLLTNVDTDELLRTHTRRFRKALGTVITAGSEKGGDNTSVLNSDSTQADQIEDREAAIELEQFLVGGNSHLNIPNDPVYNLDKLIELEAVINDLTSLSESKTNEDYTLADKARAALSQAKQGEEIRIGDTITRTFQAYQGLSEYTALNKEKAKQDYVLTISTRSYLYITRLLNPPFKVTTVADLSHLEIFADAEIDRMSAEYRSPNLKVPFTDATIDRDIVLATGPILMMVLLHLLSSYVSRSRSLIKEIHNDSSTELNEADYQKLGPPNMFSFGSAAESDNPLQHATPNKFSRIAIPLRKTIAVAFARALPVLVPLSVIGTLFYDLISNRSHSGMMQHILWLILIGSTLFMSVETYLIIRMLSPHQRNTPIKAEPEPRTTSS